MSTNFLNSVFPVSSAESNNSILQIPEIQKASEIPHFCTRIAAALEKQPPFKGSGSLFEESQVLSLPSYADARICELFHKNAMTILNNESLCICSFGCNSSVKDSKGISIKQGVILVQNGNDERQASGDDLQGLFNKVLASVQTGWVIAKAEESAHILHNEDTKQFELFIKSTVPIQQEDVLIRCMATKFSMKEQSIVCNISRTCKPECHPEKPYMWIRKSDLERVVNIFGFQFSR